MIVEMLKDIFKNGSVDEDIDRLWLVIEDQHWLLIKDDDFIESLMESSWFEGLRGIKKEVVFKLIEWSLQNPSTLMPSIIISNESDDCFTVEESYRYLRQPFTLILENSYNDSPFIDSLIKNFPKQSGILKKRKDDGWFQYDMGGGSTIPHILKTKMKSFEGASFSKEKHKYLRCFVLIDSDKKYPTEELKQEIKNLIRFLNEIGVPYHILEKREMENYLPDEAFSEIADNREYIDAYLRLNPVQKDYFDLEKGFERKRFEQFNTEIQQLYLDVPIFDKTVFRSSSLKSFNSKTANFKSDFPLFFLSNKVTKENLLKRCLHHSISEPMHPFDPNELPNLLKQISSIL